MKLKETALYLPIKQHLQKAGYEVKGEIKNCDIVAIKDNQLIIIELKLSLNITLLLQAVERFALSDIVYVAFPKQCPLYKKQVKQIKKLMARLGIGLIVVDFQKNNQYVDVISDPKDYKPRKNKRKQASLLKEFSSRIGDTQVGGSTMRNAGLTAYRQRCIRISQYLLTHKTAKGAEIKKAIEEPQATRMMYQNYYGWFEKVNTGIYQLTEKGRSELPHWLGK
ncbi:MAG: hypothetical protein KAH18_12450 [Psychromonas sp.]|nr:hypothetical protein [Psychromonas sp.]